METEQGMPSTAIAPVTGNAAGMVARQEFGATQLEKRAELSATAVAAQAEAAIRARYAMALQRPRSWDQVRLSLLAECRRPGFAIVARYAKPIGKEQDEETGKMVKKFAHGFSVRFAESAARCMGNLFITSTVVYDDAKIRIFRGTVSDLEANNTSEIDVMVEKTVERRSPKKGQVIIRQRVNTYGDAVYIIEASDDELLVKSSALMAKARRNLILQMIPGDIQEDALEAINATLADPKAVDPARWHKKLVDSFAKLHVLPSDLEAYLEHPLDRCTPTESATLRELWVSLNEGETTWKAIMDSKEVLEARGASQASDAAAQPSEPPKTVEDLKARERSAKEQRKGEPPPAGELPLGKR